MYSGSARRSLSLHLQQRASSTFHSKARATPQPIWNPSPKHLRPQIHNQVVARNMATSAAKKFEWLVILPDYEGVIEKRLEVRAKHLEGVMPLAKENKVVMGGAFFSHPPAEGEAPLPIIGSALVVYAETKEEVLELVQKDIYTKSGVWDLSKVQIWPFKSAVRSDISTTS